MAKHGQDEQSLDPDNSFHDYRRYEKFFHEGDRFVGRTESDNVSLTFDTYRNREVGYKHNSFYKESKDSLDI